MTQIEGSARIAPEVLAAIVNLTTSAVPGVMAMGDVPGRRFLTRSRHDMTRGVRLSVHANRVDIDLYVKVAQSADLARVGVAIRRDVPLAVREMLGMDVGDMNIVVQRFE